MSGFCEGTRLHQLIASNKHKGHWLPFDRQKPPPWLTLGATGNDDKREQPSYAKTNGSRCVHPTGKVRVIASVSADQSSFVVEVKASEIVPAAGTFGIGYTMRFPRCKFIYWDKASRNHPSGDDYQDRDMWNSVSA